MKFSSTPFFLLASLIAIASALPADSEYNVGLIARDSQIYAEVEARDPADSQTYSESEARGFDDELDARDPAETYAELDARSELFTDNSTSLEARGNGANGAAAAEDALTLGIKALTEIFINLANKAKQDKANRSRFTQNVIAELRKKDPSFNYVMCHTKHTTKWDGQQGKDWSHSHREFDIQIGGTIGYEIYAARSGEFTRKGDGGYLNWAFAGNVKKNDQGGKHLVFGKP